MPPRDLEFKWLAELITSRIGRIIAAWRVSMGADQTLTAGKVLPRAQLLDHIPALLKGYLQQLREPQADVSHLVDAAAHGLHRWQQGFGLAEVTRELGYLNECVVKEIDNCGRAPHAPSPEALARARSVWASVFSVAVSASTAQYFKLQQMESASYVNELEDAMRKLSSIELQRAGLWQQAAHDLRGNLGVVANVAAGLGYPSLDESAKENFLRMLGRNMRSLHNLLDDITVLARLQGGQESRRLETVDVAALLTEMGENLGAVAALQGLTLDLLGNPSLQVQSDPVKLERIVQNLVLNAIRYTESGGVKVSWEAPGPTDPDRWALQVIDTGPGIAPRKGEVLDALETVTTSEREAEHGTQSELPDHLIAEVAAGTAAGTSKDAKPVANFSQGEGIGLAIVKRMAELLDATIQVETGHTGTSFRILLPTKYSGEPNVDATDPAPEERKGKRRRKPTR